MEGAGGREGQGRKGAGLAWTLGLLHQRHRQVRCGTVLQQAVGQGLDGPGAHVDCDGAAVAGEVAPGCSRIGQVVAFQDGDATADCAMGEGEARSGRSGQQGTHTGDHLEGDARSLQGLGLLAAPTEDQRIAAFQTHHAPVLLGMLDHQTLDLGLRDAGLSAALAHGQSQGLGWKERLESWIQQGIEEDHFRLLQGPQSSDRDQVGATRAGADEADEALDFRGRKGRFPVRKEGGWALCDRLGPGHG